MTVKISQTQHTQLSAMATPQPQTIPIENVLVFDDGRERDPLDIRLERIRSPRREDWEAKMAALKEKQGS